ncbi:MAG: LptF/LptG family permease [Candidatus Goldbacteria bacterium]|nr:LptF/LptG family permease [Candidatus Goldiibacteriota bacterium]
MKILQKYVVTEILKIFFIILAAITVFITISNLLDDMPMFLRHKPSIMLIISYFFFKTPFVVAESFPFAMLLSVLFVLSQMNKFNELTAIKSLGISFYNIAVPVLILALFISMFNFVFNETIASNFYAKSKQIKENLIEKKSGGGAQIKYDLAKLGSEGRVFYIKKFDGLLGIMENLCIIKIDNDFNILERIDAKQGIWNNDKWIIKDAYVRNFTNNLETSVQKIDTYELKISDAPEDFVIVKRSFEDTLTTNLFRLKKLIDLLKQSGFQYREELVNYHLKIAFPLATFILTLLGISIPFLFHTQKSFLNAALSFIVTVITAFFYMGFLTIGLSLGKTGTLSPILSAWISNIIFIFIGFFVLVKTKK